MSLFRVTLNMLLYGSVCQNVMRFGYPLPSGTPLQDIANAIETKWCGRVRNAVATDVNFFSVTVDNITGGSGGPTFTKNFAITGNAGDEASCSLNVAAVLRLESGLSGRRNRGRVYIPGQRPGWFRLGILHSSGAAVWAAPILGLKADFLQATATDPWHLVIWTVGGPTDDYRIVTDIVLRSTPGSMRKRMIGIGI